MLLARFEQRKGRLCGVCVSGHAEYADPGEDIVCASVTSAVQLTANTMTECFRKNADVTAGENDIAISIAESDDKDGAAATLLQGLQLHLELLSKQFPENITIEITEV